jgi:DNA-binding CsgD family transcriptional regulator
MPATIARAAASPGSVPIDLEEQALSSWLASLEGARLRRFADLEIEIHSWTGDDGLSVDEKIERDELRELYDKEASRLFLDGLLPIDVEPEARAGDPAPAAAEGYAWKAGLSPQEIKVVEQLIGGATLDKEIAANIGSKEEPVRTHRRRLAKKLHAKDAKPESLLTALNLEKPTP